MESHRVADLPETPIPPTTLAGLEATAPLDQSPTPRPAGRPRSWDVPACGRMREQRRGVRYPCELNVPCRVGDQAWTAKARNLSLGGIRLLTGQRVPPGTVLRLELPCPARGEAVERTALVVHAAVTRYGSWVLGCSFEEALDAAELRDLLS